MGLLAREIEARGIPTLSMSSAYSITRSANPPRAVYLDYPLGHTSGKANDKTNQHAVMRDTFDAFETITEPGTIRTLDYEWSSDHTWKDRVMRPKADANGEPRSEDDRIERFDTPQYQSDADAREADTACPSCVFLNESR